MMTGQWGNELASVPPEHLRTLCRWMEDRIINAIAPLHLRLQRELPGNMKCDGTLQEAARCVRHVMEHVQEIRELAGGSGQQAGGQRQ